MTYVDDQIAKLGFGIATPSKNPLDPYVCVYYRDVTLTTPTERVGYLFIQHVFLTRPTESNGVKLHTFVTKHRGASYVRCGNAQGLTVEELRIFITKMILLEEDYKNGH